MTSTTIIEAHDLTFAVNNTALVDRLNFSIQAGSYVGLIGPNGGGKSTLIKLILGLIPPTSGELKVFGQSPDTIDVRRQIGYVPQRAGQTEATFPATVIEVVRSGAIHGRADETAVKEAMAIAGIEGIATRLISFLSGGERQRVYIARALVAKPHILLLDEPTAGVDAAAETTFYQFLKQLHQSAKLTIVLVSHDLDVVAKEATQILCLNKRLLFNGSPKDFAASEAVALATQWRLMGHAHDHA